MQAEVPTGARGDLGQESRGGHHLQQNHPFPSIRVWFLPGPTQFAFPSPTACSCLLLCCVFVSLGTQLYPWAHSGHSALPFISVSAAGGCLTSGPAITGVKLPVIACLEVASTHALEQGPHLCSSHSATVCQATPVFFIGHHPGK